MAKRTETVSLDGQDFTIPALNIDQLERVADAVGGGTVPEQRQGFAVLRIAMERAEPKPDFSALAPTADEIGNATKAIMKLSGLQAPTDPPKAPPAGV